MAGTGQMRKRPGRTLGPDDSYGVQDHPVDVHRGSAAVCPPETDQGGLRRMV